MTISPGEPGLAIFNEAMDDVSGGDNGAISRAKIQSNVTTNKPTRNVLQAGCPSCHSTNSVKALSVMTEAPFLKT